VSTEILRNNVRKALLVTLENCLDLKPIVAAVHKKPLYWSFSLFRLDSSRQKWSYQSVSGISRKVRKIYPILWSMNVNVCTVVQMMLEDFWVLGFKC
jgi:hypothetical protein